MNYVDLIEPLLLCDQLKLNRSVTDKQIENPQRDSYIIKSENNNNLDLRFQKPRPGCR